MKWKAYPDYKDSSTIWIGKIPKSWDIKRLKLGVRLINEKCDDLSNGMQYIGLENIQSWTGKIVTNGETTTNDGQSNLFKSGDVLFNKLRPYLAKAFIAKSEGKCTGELLVLRTKKDLDADYLCYYLLSRDFITTVDSSTYGTKMPRANWEFIGNLPILLPRIEEQRAITRFLQRKTDQIDNLIAKKQRQIELLQEKRSALISQVVTKGLDPNVKMKDSGAGWLGEIPDQWDLVPLKHLVEIKDGTHETPETVPFGEYTYPIVTSQDIKDGIISLENANRISEQDYRKISIRSNVEVNDIIMPMIGTVGNPAIVKMKQPFAIKNVALFKTSCGSLDPNYLLHFLGSNFCLTQFDLLNRGGVQGFVSLGTLRNITAFKMTLDEDKTIGTYIKEQTSRLNTCIKMIGDSVIKLHEYRTALVSAAVTGKIDVRKEVI